jgi:uracil-DNA glycosylase family 4
MANLKTELSVINEEVVRCRICPRLVEHREDIALRKVKRFADQTYWGRPVPSFGDPKAQLMIVGLAPAAHGANRTGRMFTGDRSGDWLFEAIHKFGFANQPTSLAGDDGLELSNTYITAVVRCAPPANKPNRTEIEACQGYLKHELEALREPKPKPKFGHRVTYALSDDLCLLASYHPSQQNTFTGRLTSEMFNAVFSDVRKILDVS